MTEQSRYWFPAKRYGWGWGFPTTWQGWLVIALYVVLIGAGPSSSPFQTTWHVRGLSHIPHLRADRRLLGRGAARLRW